MTDKTLREETFEERVTHLVILNLTSDSDTHAYWTRLATDMIDNFVLFDENKQNTIVKDGLTRCLIDFFQRTNPYANHTIVFSDIMLLALGYVNWGEVADRFIAIAKEQAEYNQRSG